MNYRISIIDSTKVNLFLEFAEKKNSANSPGSYYEPGLKLLGPTAAEGPRDAGISPGLLVSVGEPGLIAQPNRD